jgi:hypothetical protein
VSIGAERAIPDRARREREADRMLVNIGDPVGAIEGFLSHVEMSSVELQH